MNSVNQSPEEDIIDLKALFFTLIQNWPIILVTVTLSFLGAILYLKITLPVYSVDAMLQVEKESAGADMLLGGLGGFDGKSEVSTEIEILKSRMILGEVARSLNLDVVLSPSFKNRFDRLLNKDSQLLVNNNELGVSYVNEEEQLFIKTFDVTDSLLDQPFKLLIKNDSEYQIILEENFSLIGKNGELLETKTPLGAVKINLIYKGLSDKEFSLRKQGLLTSSDSISRRLSASEKGRGTGILSLSLQGVKKDKITHELNEIVDIYVAKNLAKKSADKAHTLDFLDDQLPKTKEILESAERKFNVFRNKNKTIDIHKEAQILLEQNVHFNRTKLELEQKRAELSARFTEDYPLLKQIDLQLDNVSHRVVELNGRLKDLPAIQQEYLRLYRDVEINTQLYTNMLQNYQKLKVARSGEIGNVRIIDKAVHPIEQVKPKKTLIILIAGILGLFLGCGLVLLKQIFNSGVKDSNQIEAITGLPVLATIPRSKTQQKFFRKFFKSKNLHSLLYLEDPQDMAIESLRSLRTALFFSMNQAENNIIMITGPSPSIGKSFVSSNFAAVLAASDKKVVVIDGDLRRGYMNMYFGQNNEDGLSEYITQDGKSPVKATLMKTLKLIPRGKCPANPSELFLSEKFQDMLKTLSEENDYVIIDSPPTLAVTDSTIIGALAGSTLVVSRYGVSQLPEIKLTVDRLQAAGCNVTGFVFNDVIKERGNANSYQYGYTYNSK